jgi:hypothetical protein
VGGELKESGTDGSGEMMVGGERKESGRDGAGGRGRKWWRGGSGD